MVMSFTPERHQEGMIALAVFTHKHTNVHTLSQYFNCKYAYSLLPLTKKMHTVIHRNSIQFHPLSVSHQHAHSYEKPINADGDMYAAHICHMSLPWQHQLPREACFGSVMGFCYCRIASYLCAEIHPLEDRLESNNTLPYDLISGLITDKLLALGGNYVQWLGSVKLIICTRVLASFVCGLESYLKQKLNHKLQSPDSLIGICNDGTF